MADIFGTGAGEVPVPTSVGTGVYYGNPTGSGAGVVPVPTGAAAGAIGISGSGTPIAVIPYSLANGVIGITGTGAGIVPVPTSAATGGSSSGSGAGVVPVATSAGLGNIEITGSGAGVVPVPKSRSGIRYDITIKSKPLFAGPERNNFAEIFSLIAYCEFYDMNGLDITLLSDYMRYTSTGDYVADENVISNQAAAGQPYFRHHLKIIPPAGFVGSFFQYELVKACPTTGEFKWFGADMPFVPKPQLGSEFLAKMGAITNGW
ncbi:MAG TPA: hypothetical protein VMV77_16815 [Bacteroidales bacterium]|nr:hypothetical protein [Bacteroidales bacterium]